MKRSAGALYPSAGSTRCVELGGRHRCWRKSACCGAYPHLFCAHSRDAQAAASRLPVLTLAAPPLPAYRYENGRQFWAGSQLCMWLPAALKRAVCFANCALCTAHLAKS